MSIPQFLAGSFRYLSTAAVTDVQTIIDDLYTELIANGWTCTVGGSGLSPSTFLSPVRADQIRITLTLTRASATALTIDMLDDAGLAITAASVTLNVDAGGNTVKYSTGPLHCYILSEKSTAVHFFRGGVLDNYPAASLVSPRPIYFASKTLNNFYEYYLYDPSTGAYVNNQGGIQRSLNWSDIADFQALSGSYMFAPLEVMIKDTNQLCGRLPHCLVTGDITEGTELTVPIDSGVTAVFIVAMTSDTYGVKPMMRKA
jgi:hypothetical protein